MIQFVFISAVKMMLSISTPEAARRASPDLLTAKYIIRHQARSNPYLNPPDCAGSSFPVQRHAGPNRRPS